MIAHGRGRERCQPDANGMGSSVSVDTITVRGYKQLKPRAIGKRRNTDCFSNLEMNALSVIRAKLSKCGSRLASG